MYLLKLFDESFVYTVLQDLAPSSLVITITQPRLVQMFRNMLSERIQTCVGGSTDDLIQYLYGPLAKLTGASESLLEIISRHITDADVSSLKEQVYNLDLHIWVHAIELVAEVDDLPEGYGPL